MKVKLLVDWAGKKAGEVMELTDTKAKRVIATGLVEKAVIGYSPGPKTAKKKRTVPKTESVSFRPGGK